MNSDKHWCRFYQLTALLAALIGHGMFALGAAGAVAGDLLTVRIVSASSGPTIVPGQNANLDVGVVSWRRGSSRPGIELNAESQGTSIKTRFGLQVDCPPGGLRAAVRLDASLRNTQPGFEVSVDGKSIAVAPVTLSAFELCGVTSSHVLVTRVAKSVPAGSIRTNIDFQAIIQ